MGQSYATHMQQYANFEVDSISSVKQNHPQLKIHFEVPRTTVMDAKQVDSFGNRKWLRSSETYIYINPEYTMEKEELQFHWLHFILYTIGGEEKTRKFYDSSTTIEEQKQLVPSDEARDLLTSPELKEVHAMWITHLKQHFECDLPSLDPALVSDVQRWMAAHGFPISKTAKPSETFAQYCAMKSCSARPLSKVIEWVQAYGLPYDKNNITNVIQVYCRAQLLHQLNTTWTSETYRPSRPDLFQIASHQMDIVVHKAGPVCKGLLFDSINRPSDSSSHLNRLKFPRRNETEAIFTGCVKNAMQPMNIEFWPIRLMDALCRHWIDFQLHSKRQTSIVQFVSNPISSSAELIRDSWEKLPAIQSSSAVCNPSYIDCLLEYGALVLLENSQWVKSNAELVENMSFNAFGKHNDSTDKHKLVKFLKAAINNGSQYCHLFLTTWLSDRKIQHGVRDFTNLSVSCQELSKIYKDTCTCMYLSSTFKTLTCNSASILNYTDMDVEFVQNQHKMQLSELENSENDYVAMNETNFDDSRFITALQLIQSDLFAVMSYEKLNRLVTLLGIKLEVSEPFVVSSKIWETLLRRLENQSSVLDVLLNARGNQSCVASTSVSVLQKLKCLAESNDTRIAWFYKYTSENKRPDLVHIAKFAYYSKPKWTQVFNELHVRDETSWNEARCRKVFLDITHIYLTRNDWIKWFCLLNFDVSDLPEETAALMDLYVSLVYPARTTIKYDDDKILSCDSNNQCELTLSDGTKLTGSKDHLIATNLKSAELSE